MDILWISGLYLIVEGVKQDHALPLEIPDVTSHQSMPVDSGRGGDQSICDRSRPHCRQMTPRFSDRKVYREYSTRKMMHQAAEP